MAFGIAVMHRSRFGRRFSAHARTHIAGPAGRNNPGNPMTRQRLLSQKEHLTKHQSNYMKRSLIISCIIAASCLLSNSQNAPDPGTIRQTLKERIEKEKRATAIVVGIIDEHATNVIASGTTALNSSQAADGDTVFEIGSVTKVFTSLLLADMVQKGEVKLDDPISKYLPASVKVPTRNGKQITLLDLATHSSGLPGFRIISNRRITPTLTSTTRSSKCTTSS